MSMDSFAGHQLPDQFDVSLTASAPMIASDLSQSFSDFLNTFDFRAHSGDPLQDPSPPHVDTVPELDPSPEIWQMWTRTDNASSDVLPSAALTAGHELPPYDQMHMEQSMVQESTPSADYLHTFPEVVHEESIQAQGPPQVQQQPDSSQRLAIPSHYPPHLAEDPDFVEVYAQYVSKMQQRCIQANAHAGPHHDHLTYTPQDQPQSQVTHDEVQYQAQAYTPNGLHHTSYSEPQPLSPPSSTSGDVHCGSGYVPPSGAATTIGLRRVGGTWRPPVGPPPSEDSTSRVPSWGSVAST
ncbi:uncharacterized protein PHACADRAFT_257556 [Phanerochaete carnosa HHB-10118-sp]|uniref:Uncharacterized protein n=1 Tax=Phanerochaete carnosa (strain HHB-10118-sp) TaxID=650164 RepID=K5UVF8_PHACS|nr:uncharacterized protein PHACADRAFT_257556 [Phanerochaete carnosa HHB-10118-sp]EKM54001.1 hypothetical protein PHACADRAFT_257556 [Phanerochaete carnosa HHB-10118-sp]